MSLKIKITAKVFPSEDPERVIKALTNLFGEVNLEFGDEEVFSSSDKMEILKKVKEGIKAKQAMPAFKRILLNNKGKESTYFYLNKQAAYMGKVSLCEEEGESPLKPIKVEISSQKIDELIKELTSN
ncbi:MAG: RNA-binding domain-containing protein [Nitrososphaerales archaeon]